MYTKYWRNFIQVKLCGQKAEEWPRTALGAPRHAQHVGLFSGSLQSPHRGSVMGSWAFFMAAVGPTQLLHPGRSIAVGPWLLICEGGSLLISQQTCISRGHSTICRLVDVGGSSYSSALSTVHRESKKGDTILLSISSLNIDRFS